MILRVLSGLVIACGLVASGMCSSVHAAGETGIVAAVRAADDERVAASIAMDGARLAAVLSPELRYAHSNGSVDTQQSYTASILEGRSVYQGYRHTERTFAPVADDIMLMTGSALIATRSGDQPLQLHLGYLAVWRLENGVWRFRAWQSCRLPPPAE